MGLVVRSLTVSRVGEEGEGVRGGLRPQSRFQMVVWE